LSDDVGRKQLMTHYFFISINYHKKRNLSFTNVLNIFYPFPQNILKNSLTFQIRQLRIRIWSVG